MIIKTTHKRILGTVGAVLAMLLAWDQLGGWMPASQASVEANRVYSEDTRLLVLYAQLDDLRHRLHDARQDNNDELVIELNNRIDHVKREIAKLENKDANPRP